MNWLHLVVRTAAPIAAGQEIEVRLVQFDRASEAVLVRDLSTSVLYGSGGALCRDEPARQVLGWRDDYRAPRLAEGARVVRTFRGRVVECVVANVRQNSGETEVATSFLVEVLGSGETPYR